MEAKQWKVGDSTQAIPHEDQWTHQTCPVCDSGETVYQLSQSDIDFDFKQMYVPVYCEACNSSWQDVYTIEGRVNVEPGTLPLPHGWSVVYQMPATIYVEVSRNPETKWAVDKVTVSPDQVDLSVWTVRDDQDRNVSIAQEGLEYSIPVFDMENTELHNAWYEHSAKNRTVSGKYAVDWEG